MFCPECGLLTDPAPFDWHRPRSRHLDLVNKLIRLWREVIKRAQRDHTGVAP